MRTKIAVVLVAITIAGFLSLSAFGEKAGPWDSLKNIDAARLEAGSVASAIDGSAITNVLAGSLAPGSVLPAVDGSAVTNITAGNIEVGGTLLAIDGSALTNLLAGSISAGGTFLAIDGNALTNLDAAALAAGTTLGALDGGNLTNVTASGGEEWSSFPATNTVDGGGNIFSNANYQGDGGGLTNLQAESLAVGSVLPALDGSGLTNLPSSAGAEQWSSYPATNTVDFASFAATNVGAVAYATNTTIPEATESRGLIVEVINDIKYEVYHNGTIGQTNLTYLIAP